MSRDFVLALQASFDRGQAMIDKFVESCSADLWAQKRGGYPLWQQIYHLMACIEFFVSKKDNVPQFQLYGVEVFMLDSFPEKIMTQKETIEYNKNMKDMFAGYMKEMTDEKLLQKHEGGSQRMHTDLRHIDIINMAVAHIFYHLGTVDAILREDGLNGIYGM